MSIVVKTIIEQLGGKCLFMLGAQNLVSDGDDLIFKIRGSRKVSHIKIHLNSMDLYDITFIKVHGASRKEVSVVEGIYDDMLHKTIETNTGLYTSL